MSKLVIENGVLVECLDKKVKEVVVPDGVTAIGGSVFKECRVLQSVTIPKDVTSIGENAFRSCKSLESIDLPDKIAFIGTWAFAHCSSLTLYLEAKSKPKRWSESWNPNNRPVVRKGWPENE